VEAALLKGRWSRSELPTLLRAVDAASKTSANRDVLGRLRLGTGLYAFLLDERAVTAKEWRAARRLGPHNPRLVTAAIWTPGAIEGFKATE